MTHIFQDLAVLHYETGEYEKGIDWANQLIHISRKTATRTHNSSGLIEVAHTIIN